MSMCNKTCFGDFCQRCLSSLLLKCKTDTLPLTLNIGVLSYSIMLSQQSQFIW
jgi:hypothetical protein